MLKIEYTTQFKRDLNLANKRKKNMVALQQIMTKIQYEETINPRFKDHPLTGNWRSHRELHIEPDWLLIYKLIPQENTVIFVRTGTHSDLFK
ncbi:MAG: type II toxin-antitoxin system YafQ family toxin [Gammaproteobacteria bacterium]|nr:type II toxin-antitoxin system YafQ family toxin [Gammaproteobacteria bacterium]